MLGKIFGKWTVLEEAEPCGAFDRWTCRCACGTIRATRGHHLRAGRTISCGCSRRKVDAIRKHRLYHTYRGMIERCEYVKHIGYSNYGGKGVQVCAAWRHDAREFYRWAESSGWREGLQIDRIDSAGNYCPENCRWVNTRVQSQNTSKSDRRVPTGVRKCGKRYTARIGFGNRKEVHLGSYNTAAEAHSEYAAAVQNCRSVEEALRWRKVKTRGR